jgi:hypothetical protein
MMSRMKELEDENRRLKQMYIEEKLKAEIVAECIDPAETAQVRLMHKPQQAFSCPTPGVDASGCTSQSSHQ